MNYAVAGDKKIWSELSMVRSRHHV